MPRVSTNHTQAAELKIAILAARSTGASYRVIASSLGCSVAYVQQVSNAPAAVPVKVSPDVIKARALELKQDAVNNRKRRGVLPIMADVARELQLGQDDLPSYGTFQKWFYTDRNDLSVARYAVDKGAKGRYWFEDKPLQHGERALIDTGIVAVAGINYQLVLMIDWYSRVAHCELLPMRFMSSLPWFLKRAFQAFGTVPVTIQSDNGIGLTCGSLVSIRPFSGTHLVKVWNVGNTYQLQKLHAMDVLKSWLIPLKRR